MERTCLPHTRTAAATQILSSAHAPPCDDLSQHISTFVATYHTHFVCHQNEINAFLIDINYETVSKLSSLLNIRLNQLRSSRSKSLFAFIVTSATTAAVAAAATKRDDPCHSRVSRTHRIISCASDRRTEVSLSEHAE